MKKKEKSDSKICSMCKQEKDDIKAYRLLLFKKNLCDNCYYQKITSTIKKSAIISGIYVIPLLITLFIDIVTNWELQFSPFVSAYLILSLLTINMFSPSSLFFGYFDDYFSDYFNFILAYDDSDNWYTNYLFLKLIAFLFKAFIGALLLPIIVTYNLTILINAILVFKKVKDKNRLLIVLATFAILLIITIVIITALLTLLN